MDCESIVEKSQYISKCFNQAMLERDTKTLLSYYFSIVNEAESGDLRRTEALYLISRTSTYQVVNCNIELEAVVMLSDELLAPKPPVSWTVKDDRWFKFVRIINHFYILYNSS